MSEKASAEVIIGGKIYTLSGYEGEEYLQKVAAYINNKISEFNSMEAMRHFPYDMKATLIQLNIADDYFKAKAQVERLEQELEQKDKEIYDLKHDLISCQIKCESEEKARRELEEENEKLSQRKAVLTEENEKLSQRREEAVEENKKLAEENEKLLRGTEAVALENKKLLDENEKLLQTNQQLETDLNELLLADVTDEE